MKTDKQDKLDTLFSYLLEEDTESVSPNNKFASLLLGLMQDHKAFWFVFENVPEKIKTTLFNTNKNFVNNFFRILGTEDDTKFNSYFFNDNYKVKEFFHIDTVRYFALSRPNNKQLKQYIHQIDNPSSLPELVNLLTTVVGFDNYERFEEIVKNNQSLLQKKHTVKNQKSLEKIYNLLNNIYNKNGFKFTLEMSKLLDIDLLERELGNPIVYNRFDLLNKKNITQKSLTAEDMQALKDFLSSDDKKLRYTILKDNFEMSDIVESMECLAQKAPEYIEYFWNIYEEYLEEVRKMYNMKGIKNKGGIEVLKKISQSYQLAMSRNQNSLAYGTESELLDRIYNVEKIVLSSRLNNTLPEDIMVQRKYKL